MESDGQTGGRTISQSTNLCRSAQTFGKCAPVGMILRTCAQAGIFRGKYAPVGTFCGTCAPVGTSFRKPVRRPQDAHPKETYGFLANTREHLAS